MPSENKIYGALSLFGIRVMLESDNQAMLDSALARFPAGKGGECTSSSVYAVLRTYGVNAFDGAEHRVEGAVLSIRNCGIRLCADGAAGCGLCECPESADPQVAGDMIQTLVLFLVAQAGRIPVHASAFLSQDTAIVLAGRSGSGKSCLALAASRAGLPVLSEDTVFVQMNPQLKLWSLPGPVHLLARDCAEEAEGHRFRNGKRKNAFAVPLSAQCAGKAILCVLAPGERAGLAQMAKEAAIAELAEAPEPGFDFYGPRAKAALAALAGDGAWRLTLSRDPAEAIGVLCRQFLPRA